MDGWWPSDAKLEISAHILAAPERDLIILRLEEKTTNKTHHTMKETKDVVYRTKDPFEDARRQVRYE